MAKNEEYKGSIDLISGLRPKNGADFPLMEAADILTGEDNKRLDADLANIFAQLLTMATQEYVQSKIAELVASSPETLDTLNELAAALGNDPNFATTVLNQLGTKVDKVTGKGLSTNDFTDVYLNMLLKAVVVYNGEFSKVGNIPIVSSGREVKDSGVALSNLLQAPYIWYANQNAVALRTNPSAKIGGIEEFKVDNNMFVVMSASTVIGTAIVPDLTATTVDASVSAGNYSKFHNGDLLLYAGNALGKDIWRWIPQAEAKEDRDGLESAWDKQQINKVPTLEGNLSNLTGSFNSLKSAVANMPQQVTFHTEEALLNWISVYGVHYCVAQAGNGANPLGDEYGLEYLIHVGREYDGSALTGNRFQLAMHIRTGKLFYRVGPVSSGASFGSYTWSQLTSGYMTEVENESITEEKLNGVVLDRMTEVIECTQADIDAGKHVYPFSGNYRNVRYINSRYGGTSYKFPETIPERDGGEHYKAYHVEILQEYEQSEECNAFLSAFDCRTAGHYDVDIVYDFVNSKWRVTNYVVKPYAEGAE